MRRHANPDTLLRSSIIVTGAHYSMTSLAGSVLAASGQYHLLHEPANAQPTLSYDSLKPDHWYEYYGADRVGTLSEFLTGALASENLTRNIVNRAAQIRSSKDALQVARYVQRKAPMKIFAKPAIIKDPFLVFSARSLQALMDIRVVLTLRHPCAFAESFVRAGHRFDFADLLQPHVLDALPEERAIIARLARDEAPLIEQAAHLWRIIYGFAAKYLVKNPRTHVLTQEALVLETVPALERLFAFAGITQSARATRFAHRNLQGSGADFVASGSYVRRDGVATLNKWRHRLSSDQIATVRALAGEMAGKFGYLEEAWP